MNIYKKEASSLVWSIINHSESHFKNLSQVNRKICIKAIECLSSKKDDGVKIFLSKSLSFDDLTSAIQRDLALEPKKKQFFLIKLIQSMIKGILNFCNLRISSKKVYEKIALYKKEHPKLQDQSLNPSKEPERLPILDFHSLNNMLKAQMERHF